MRGRHKLDNPLCNDIKVRLDDETHNKLLEYCQRHNVQKAQVIRKLIKQFLEESED
jgi:predicted DNA-binding protein